MLHNLWIKTLHLANQNARFVGVFRDHRCHKYVGLDWQGCQGAVRIDGYSCFVRLW